MIRLTCYGKGRFPLRGRKPIGKGALSLYVTDMSSVISQPQSIADMDGKTGLNPSVVHASV
jgi:hypothetical protein